MIRQMSYIYFILAAVVIFTGVEAEEGRCVSFSRWRGSPTPYCWGRVLAQEYIVTIGRLAEPFKGACRTHPQGRDHTQKKKKIITPSPVCTSEFIFFFISTLFMRVALDRIVCSENDSTIKI